MTNYVNELYVDQFMSGREFLRYLLMQMASVIRYLHVHVLICVDDVECRTKLPAAFAPECLFCA